MIHPHRRRRLDLTCLVLTAAASLPSQAPSPATGAPSRTEAATQEHSLLRCMQEQPELRTLLKLVRVAELEERLQDLSAEPITVFAPSSDALRKLGFMFLKGMTSDGSEDELADLLRAHMVPGALDATAVAAQRSPLTSLSGGPIPVQREDGAMRIAGHRILASIRAANGIVHVLDGVIQPSAECLDAEQPDVLVDFRTKHAVGGWQEVHDSVMGGRSDGAMTRGGDDFGRFAGETSLANNGGFASLVTALTAGRLDDADGVTLRVRGDGRTYRFALRESAAATGGTFWCEFPTTKGEWTDVTIPFAKFEKNYMGFALPGRIAGKDVRGLGFYIYDKKAGPFALDVAWIRASRSM